MGIIYTGGKLPEPSYEHSHVVTGKNPPFTIRGYSMLINLFHIRFIGTYNECRQWVSENSKPNV